MPNTYNPTSGNFEPSRPFAGGGRGGFGDGFSPPPGSTPDFQVGQGAPPGTGMAPGGFNIPSDVWQTGPMSTLNPAMSNKEPTTLTAYRNTQDPQSDWIIQKLEGMMGGGGGGGGGFGIGGFGTGGDGLGIPNQEMRASLDAAIERSLDPSQAPFGQSAVNVRTRAQAGALEFEQEKINRDFGARGAQGTPEHQEAIRQSRMNYRQSVGDTTQQMAEAQAQFSLNAIERAGQIDNALAQINAGIDTAEAQIRAQLLQQRRSLAASRGRAKAAQNLGIIDRMMSRDQFLMNYFADERGKDSANFWNGKNWQMGVNEFNRNMFESDREHNYTVDFNNKMMEAQKRNSKNQIFDAIGGFLGNIGGAALGLFGGGGG